MFQHKIQPVPKGPRLSKTVHYGEIWFNVVQYCPYFENKLHSNGSGITRSPGLVLFSFNLLFHIYNIFFSLLILNNLKLLNIIIFFLFFSFCTRSCVFFKNVEISFYHQIRNYICENNALISNFGTCYFLESFQKIKSLSDFNKQANIQYDPPPVKRETIVL